MTEPMTDAELAKSGECVKPKICRFDGKWVVEYSPLDTPQRWLAAAVKWIEEMTARLLLGIE